MRILGNCELMLDGRFKEVPHAELLSVLLCLKTLHSWRTCNIQIFQWTVNQTGDKNFEAY
jgi:hypothetical protein